jgi:arabinogalactan oligomer/maltooligosaccharide transport system substrate-binding protein
MNKKLKISVLGLPLLLVACGGTPSEGPVKLKIWGPNQEQNFLQAKAQEFITANPDVNVEFEFAAVGEPELKSVLTLDIAGGADVFAFPDDQLQDLVTAGALSPVQQYRTDVIARNIEWSVDLAKIGDTLYAYPNTADNGVFMYYDKRYISAEEMTSLDSILAKAEELDSSIVIDPMGGWAMSMWFATSGNISWDAATRTQTIDWNNAAGLEAAKGMFNAYATNRVIRDQGLMPTLFLENEEDITKGIIAGVSGTWNANSFTGILGEENIGMIKMPTFTHGNNEEVQLGSMVGAKLIGVNGFTQQPEIAHQFANFLTNAETQIDRALQLGVGPSNLEAADDEEVQAIPSIKAISDQAPYGIPQAKSVSSVYWTPAGAFANAVITEARGIDTLVEENLQAAITAETVENNETAIAAFRATEKARLIALSFETLQDKLDAFVEGVLAVNEG